MSSKQQTFDGYITEVVSLPYHGVRITVKELEEMYLEDKMSMADIADELSVEVTSVFRLLNEAGIDRRSPTEAGELLQERRREELEYANPDLLKHLHHEKKMSLSEIAKSYGLTQSGIKYWFEEFEIETRDYYRYQIPKFELSCSDGSGYRGYPVWRGCDGQTVAVHHLVLIAEGEDPRDVFGNLELNCHHRNGFKCDNRPSNLELVDRSEHGRKHSSAGNYSRKWTDDDIESTIRLMLNVGELIDEEQ